MHTAQKTTHSIYPKMKITTINSQPPDGFKLFKSPLEYVLGMQVLSFDGEHWVDDKQFQLYPSPNDIIKIISEKRLAYQVLTEKMIVGPYQWWNLDELPNQKHLKTPISILTLIIGRGSLAHAVKEIKHPWLYEQLVYLHFNLDITPARTKFHPQFIEPIPAKAQ